MRERHLDSYPARYQTANARSPFRTKARLIPGPALIPFPSSRNSTSEGQEDQEACRAAPKHGNRLDLPPSPEASRPFQSLPVGVATPSPLLLPLSGESTSDAIFHSMPAHHTAWHTSEGNQPINDPSSLRSESCAPLFVPAPSHESKTSQECIPGMQQLHVNINPPPRGSSLVPGMPMPAEEARKKKRQRLSLLPSLLPTPTRSDLTPFRPAPIHRNESHSTGAKNGGRLTDLSPRSGAANGGGG